MNMRIRKQRLLFALSLVAILAVLGTMTFLLMPRADTLDLSESREIFTLYNTYNMAIIVTFDEELPVVQFITPDGTFVDMESIQYRTGGNFIEYFLPNAMPGVWRMTYAPLSNSEIITHYSVYMPHILIRDFTVDALSSDESSLSIAFMVSADEPGEFSYEIHAVFVSVCSSIADEILLLQGYGMLNEIFALTVDTGEIADKDSFMLRLSASVQHGQATILDTTWLDLRPCIQ